VFSGNVTFSRARFSGGTVDFSRAAFAAGTVDFSGAVFSGARVSFFDVAVSGGAVDFSRVADWSHPPNPGWIDPPPTGVKLPSAALATPSNPC